MSIRIQNDGLQGTAASQTGRTQDIVQIGGGAGRSGARIGGPTDQVEISSLFGQIADASSAAATSQANRVKQLAALYQSGRYEVDSMAVSRAMVSQALNGGGLDGD